MFFEYPFVLLLLLILIPLIAMEVYRERRPHPSLRVSAIAQWSSGKGRFKKNLRHLPFIFRMLLVASVIIAIARPRSSSQFEKTNAEGIDIILAMDVSTSMLARDFTPDRIQASKDIAIEFISGRVNDRMGIVVFAAESYTQAPLTTDRAALINMMKDVETGLIDDGTAIGNGIATAVSRLKDSGSKSKVIILLTDGVNNSGEVPPIMAAEIAKTYGIRIYTIGVGAMGVAPYPVMTPFGVQIQPVKVEIDEPLLKKIADTTGGKYFRATDNTKLMEIYGEISQMEKSKTTVDSFPMYKELFMIFALIALVALILEILFRFLIIKKIP